MKRLVSVGLLFLLAAGCTNTRFVYQPSAPVAGGPKLPVKIAVLPFKDGTEDFTKRGNELFDQEKLAYNLAKAGWGGVMTALTPELWAKAFADDMAASGSFASVRFVYDPSEMTDEGIRIEGTVEKATFAGMFDRPNEFALGLRALRGAGDKVAWEKNVSMKWIERPSLYDGCGAMSVQCMADRHKADANRVMRELFAEARADLASTLAPLAGGGAGAGTKPSVAPSAEPAPSSVDETIEGILKGK
jgi:hypothetical protein